jgi:hypothetical protein
VLLGSSGLGIFEDSNVKTPLIARHGPAAIIRLFTSIILSDK